MGKKAKDLYHNPCYTFLIYKKPLNFKQELLTQKCKYLDTSSLK